MSVVTGRADESESDVMNEDESDSEEGEEEIEEIANRSTNNQDPFVEGKKTKTFTSSISQTQTTQTEKSLDVFNKFANQIYKY